MAALNNLYPPIIDTFMPAFIYRATCKVYFSLSDYNSEDEIKNVQVTVVRQDNNRTALSYSKYPSAIKVTTLQKDDARVEDDKYFIEIEIEDLQRGYFEKNSFYKVQIRFTSIEASDFVEEQPIASWFTENLEYFSEWSTVCLIKGIEQPEILLTGLTTSDINILTSPTLSVVGELHYADVTNLEKEFLKYYQIILKQEGAIIVDSGNVFTDPYSNPNEINYTLKYYLEQGVNYTMELIYTTNNLYTNLATV